VIGARILQVAFSFNIAMPPPPSAAAANAPAHIARHVPPAAVAGVDALSSPPRRHADDSVYAA